MEEKELKVKDIPWGYALCFNDACSLKDKCLHHLARLMRSDGRDIGQAVFPTAWQDGECRCFREKKLVKKAWGHHGENKLSPKQQADILAIIAKFCPIEGVRFDHYVTDWDFD